MRYFPGICAALLVFAVTWYAIAAQSVGVGMSYHYITDAISVSDAVASATSGEALIFPAGRKHRLHAVVLSADGDITCCWSQHRDATVTAAGLVTNPGDTVGYRGACFQIAGTDKEQPTVNQAPDWRAYQDLGAQPDADGLCNASRSVAGIPVYAPCANDADCTPFNGTDTCDTSVDYDRTSDLPRVDRAGLFLICIAASGTVNLNGELQYIPDR